LDALVKTLRIFYESGLAFTTGAVFVRDPVLLVTSISRRLWICYFRSYVIPAVSTFGIIF
jgi:hypothetical protein